MIYQNNVNITKIVITCIILYPIIMSNEISSLKGLRNHLFGSVGATLTLKGVLVDLIEVDDEEEQVDDGTEKEKEQIMRQIIG